MEGYLGTVPIDAADTEFANYTPKDWALYFIGSYGQIDGEHHKTWVLDQVARILRGTPVLISKASWANGHSELRVKTEEPPSKEYKVWVDIMLGATDEEGYREYDYDVGIPP